MKFRTTIAQSGGATGIPIPDDVMESLGAGKKPAVRLTVNGYSYRSTVGTVDGSPMVGFNSQHREASGLRGGDEVEVEIQLDTEPREVDVSADLAAALDAEPKARETFEKLSNSNKKWHTYQVETAKTDETRQRRIAKSVEMLREGRAR